MKIVLGRVLSSSVVLIASITLLAAPVLAQSTEPDRSSSPEAPATDRAPETFGPGTIALQVPAGSFHPRQGTGSMTYAGVGYQSRATGSDLMWAPLQLPNGVVIDTIEGFFYDTSAANGSLILTRFFGTNSFEDIGSASTAGTTGFQTVSYALNRTVDNTNNIYVIYVDLPIDPALTFKGARVLYRRQVSPAPATATFTDVPTGHLFFPFIEALARSGITSGCAPGQFCPGASITRGEMAAFLSIALGLYWP
jgi:hypothetical protein